MLHPLMQSWPWQIKVSPTQSPVAWLSRAIPSWDGCRGFASASQSITSIVLLEVKKLILFLFHISNFQSAPFYLARWLPAGMRVSKKALQAPRMLGWLKTSHWHGDKIRRANFPTETNKQSQNRIIFGLCSFESSLFARETVYGITKSLKG